MAKLKLSFPTFHQPTTVVSGTGSLAALRDAQELDRTVYFISGHDSVKAALTRVLGKAGCELTDENHLTKPPGEPTAEMIRLGSEFLKRHDVQRIVGIGGGSTLDWCRLAMADACSALDMPSGKVSIGATHTMPEQWLIPTTPATGAEAAQVAVYLHDSNKVAATSPAFIADQVVLDGRFLSTISADALAASVCDTLSHGVEAFCSIIPIHLAKEAAVASLQLVLRNFSDEPSTCRNERLLEAGFLGGVAASNCSVGVVHAFAHSVAHLGIPHSVGNALGLVAGLRINDNTPVMGKLVNRLGLRNVDELAAAISPITSVAIRANSSLPGITQLSDVATRADVVQRMLGDVCLRSNPQTLDESELGQFLQYVDQAIQSA